MKYPACCKCGIETKPENGGGAMSTITGNCYCTDCLNKKFKKEGTPFSRFKNAMLNLIEGYPSPMTAEQIIRRRKWVK